LTSNVVAAVVGLGVGEAHARTYAQLERCSVRWLYDLDRTRAAAVSASLGQGAVAESYAAVLEDRDVDVVSIASYDDAHFEQVVASLRAGKHVFVEKPLCRTIDELRTVRDTWSASARRLQLQSNLVLRAAPLYRWLKSAVEAGELGDIYAFDGDYLYGRLHKMTDGWRRNVDDYSVLEGGGVHLIDLMLWITGQRPARVAAVGNRISTEGSAFRYDDFAAATFQFASGLIGRVTANFGCVHPHQHVVRLFGTKAAFISDDRGPRLFTARDPAVPVRHLDLDPLPSTKGDLIPAFVAAIVDRADTRRATEHEFAVISACVAAERALRRSETVDVEYV